MGYSTDFNGKFSIAPALPETLTEFFKKFNETRRMGRNVDKQYGIEGEFYVNGGGSYGQASEANIINGNTPPKTQPGLWCQWIAGGNSIEWDGGEKFYAYEDWMYYLINRILKPLGYTVSGAVTWSGEESEDIGTLIVVNNVLFIVEGAHVTDAEEFEFYFKKGKAKKHENDYTQMVDSLPTINNSIEGGSIKLLN